MSKSLEMNCVRRTNSRKRHKSIEESDVEWIKWMKGKHCSVYLNLTGLYDSFIESAYTRRRWCLSEVWEGKDKVSKASFLLLKQEKPLSSSLSSLNHTSLLLLFVSKGETNDVMIKSLLSQESPSFEGKLFLRLHPFSSWINIKGSLPHLFSSLLSSSASKTRGFDRKERNKKMMLFFPAVFSSSCFSVILNASQETSALNIHSILTLLLTVRTSLVLCFKRIRRYLSFWKIFVCVILCYLNPSLPHPSCLDSILRWFAVKGRTFFQHHICRPRLLTESSDASVASRVILNKLYLWKKTS